MATLVDVGSPADALYKRAPVETVMPRLRSGIVRVEGCSTSRVALALIFVAAVVSAFIVLVCLPDDSGTNTAENPRKFRMSTLWQMSWIGCVAARCKEQPCLWCACVLLLVYTHSFGFHNTDNNRAYIL